MPARAGRKRPVPLQRHSKGYSRALLLAWQAVVGFLWQHSLSPADCGYNPARWDPILIAYGTALHQEGISLTRFVAAILVIQKAYEFPRWMLPKSWKLAWRWKRSQMASLHAPLPERILHACVGAAFSLAFAATDFEGTLLWLSAGLSWWMGFEMLLRPGELLAASRRLITLASDLTDDGGWISLAIEDPKTRIHFGFRQFAHVVNRKLESWLAFYFKYGGKDDRLFTGSSHKLTELMRAVFRLLSLGPDFPCTLASLRAGGATAAFMRDRNLSTLQMLGRWKQPATMFHYIQTSASAMHLAAVPLDARCSVRAAAEFFERLGFAGSVGNALFANVPSASTR